MYTVYDNITDKVIECSSKEAHGQVIDLIRNHSKKLEEYKEKQGPGSEKKVYIMYDHNLEKVIKYQDKDAFDQAIEVAKAYSKRLGGGQGYVVHSVRPLSKEEEKNISGKIPLIFALIANIIFAILVTIIMALSVYLAPERRRYYYDYLILPGLFQIGNILTLLIGSIILLFLVNVNYKDNQYMMAWVIQIISLLFNLAFFCYRFSTFYDYFADIAAGLIVIQICLAVFHINSAYTYKIAVIKAKNLENANSIIKKGDYLDKSKNRVIVFAYSVFGCLFYAGIYFVARVSMYIDGRECGYYYDNYYWCYWDTDALLYTLWFHAITIYCLFALTVCLFILPRRSIHSNSLFIVTCIISIILFIAIFPLFVVIVIDEPRSGYHYTADCVLGVFAALYLLYVLIYGIYVTLTFKNECSKNKMIPLGIQSQNELASLEYTPGQLNKPFMS